MTLIGALRYQEHRSVPEIHAALRARGVPMSERSVTNLRGQVRIGAAADTACSSRISS